MNQFEKNVRTALIANDMSLGYLAKKLGISQAYLYDIFKGNRPGTKQKEKIVQILRLEGSTQIESQNC